MADEKDKNAAPDKGGKSKLIVLILAILVLGGAGVGGTLYFTGMLGGKNADGESAKTETEAHEVKKEPIYFAFPQPFTVNFQTETGLRFLQVSIEVMSHDQVAVDAIQVHMPVIKNNIILLLSAQTFDELVSIEGKTALQEKILKEIQGILDKNETHAKVEEVYFTNFVMQ